jgi:hypothetical protein
MKSFLLITLMTTLSATVAFTSPSNAIRIPASRNIHLFPQRHILESSGCTHKRSLLYMGEENNTPTQNDEFSDEDVSRVQRWRKKLFPPKPDDGLTFRQRLTKMGLSVVLSYGWVSNVSYSVSVSLAWYIFSKRTGLSPLAPGQWKPFLAVYAGFFVFNNVIRPVRVGLSIGVASYFDSIVNAVQDKLRVSKSVAVALTVFFANVVGTIALMCAGITLASLAAGVPVFAAKL